MIRNYFKSAFRNLWRNKNFTLINISGLAVGIGVCLVIFLVIQFELSFENFHPNKNHIYRILTELHSEDGVKRTAGVPFPLPTALHNDFPSIKTSAVYSSGDDQILVLDEKGQMQKKFKEETGVFFTEPAFFEIFNFPLIAGEVNSLKDPNTALITKTTAEKYFGDWHLAMGKTFRQSSNGFNATQDYKITGVLADIPQNTDFQIKIVGSYATLTNFTKSTDWISVASNHGAYMLLPESATVASINDQFKSFVKKYKSADTQKNLQLIQPLNEVHYDTEISNFLQRTISKSLINSLWLIALFILLIACVNFINLSTAQAVNRSKEIGVRKVLGGNRSQLKFQFFTETALITIAAVLLSILLVILSIPALNNILKLPLTFDLRANPNIILFLLGISVIVIFMAGFYPALVLSKFNPITALKSKFDASRSKGVSLRRGLVVFQFMIAQALIIGTLIIVKQMAYFNNQPLGFEKNAIITVAFPEDSIAKIKLPFLKDKLLAINGVKSVSLSFASPADEGNWNSNFRFDHADKETDFSANLKWADADYLKTYNIELAAGRNIMPSDTVREYLVNETLLSRLGITDPTKALNKDFDMWGGQLKGQIVGVVKDFHSVSLKKAMMPVIIASQRNFYSKAGIKMDANQIPGILKQVGSVWNEVYPDYVYEPKFLDATIEKFYAQENKLSYLYKIFAALAIFLSCLGLYGLASFMAAQRIKEVGIRKVLGASVNNIIMLFSKEFLVLIAIAFVIAAPLAWYFMHDWLKDFVYRINISFWILLLAGISAAIVALITISFQAIRAAIANPVKSLRSE